MRQRPRKRNTRMQFPKARRPSQGVTTSRPSPPLRQPLPSSPVMPVQPPRGMEPKRNTTRIRLKRPRPKPMKLPLKTPKWPCTRKSTKWQRPSFRRLLMQRPETPMPGISSRRSGTSWPMKRRQNKTTWRPFQRPMASCSKRSTLKPRVNTSKQRKLSPMRITPRSSSSRWMHFWRQMLKGNRSTWVPSRGVKRPWKTRITNLPKQHLSKPAT